MTNNVTVVTLETAVTVETVVIVVTLETVVTVVKLETVVPTPQFVSFNQVSQYCLYLSLGFKSMPC